MQKNIKQVCQEWEQRGFSCDIWSDPPGQVWANFIHATDELVMLLEGELELEYSARCIQPEVGKEILIPAGVSHTVRNIGTCQNRWLYGYRNQEDCKHNA